MPTYSYKCTDCDAAFDIHQEFTDEALTVCPTCGGRLRKVFSSIGVTFNGPGFYSTDSRSTSTSRDAAHPSPATTTPESSPGTSGTADKKTTGTSEKKPAGETKKKSASPAPVS